MHFSENELYHIYNRGNNRQKIFFEPRNYIFFLNKVRKYILPHCDILAWCLMPNHFHIMINADERTVMMKKIAGQEKNVLSEGVRNLLSSYTQAINKQNKTVGSLFQQNTKAKLITNGSNLYGRACFHYIHQNPLTAKLTGKMEDWAYSSFADFCGQRQGTLSNKKLAFQLLDLNMETFYAESYKSVREDDINNIL